MLIIYWVVWIIIILSARYIWNVIFEEMLQSWDATWLNWVDLAQTLYKNSIPIHKNNTISCFMSFVSNIGR